MGFLRADFSRIIFDSYSQSVLNSFGISGEYITKLQKQSAQNRTFLRWEHLLNQFDKNHDFIPVLKNIMTKANIPQEFLFLAMAESGFSLRAYSTKKAAGIWQIMPKTAKSLGLKIDDYVDERRDPIKSTIAAAKYLQFLYRATGEWYLAAMAYNCGINRLKKAIKKAGSKDIEVLLDEKKRYLPKETRAYMRLILEMSLAFNAVERLQSANKQYLLNRGASDSIVGIKVKSGTMLQYIANQLGMTLDEIKQYNRQFRYDFLPPDRREHTMYIPYAKLSSFRQNYDPNMNLSHIFILHEIKRGDTLIKLAKKYKVAVQAIKIVNKMHHTRLRVKSKLIIPIVKENYKKIALKKHA